MFTCLFAGSSHEAPEASPVRTPRARTAPELRGWCLAAAWAAWRVALLEAKLLALSKESLEADLSLAVGAGA